MKRKTCLKKTFACLSLILTLLANYSVHAQSIVNATHSDQSLGCCFAGIETINSDMIDQPFGSKLWVVAYSGYDLSMNNICKLVVYENSGIIGTIDLTTGGGLASVPDARHPDVVIGDDRNNVGKDYLIGVVFEGNTNMSYYETYSLTNVGVSTTLSPTPNCFLQIPASLTASCPHIDLYADRGSNGTGYHVLNDFVLTWTRSVSVDTGVDSGMIYSQIAAYIGDLNTMTLYNYIPYEISPGYSPGSPHPHPMPNEQGINSDVAAVTYTSTQSGNIDHTAYIVYKTGNYNMNENIMLAQLNPQNAPLFNNYTVTRSTLSSPNQTTPPRIEAKNLCTPSGSYATYQAVASVDYGSGYVIETYNDVAGNTTCSLSSTDNQYAPVVTGVGNEVYTNTSSNVGENEYAIGYYSTYTNNGGGNTNGDFYSNFIDIGGINPGVMTNTNYYEINNSNLNGVNNAISLSTTSNTGDDLLSVWFWGNSGTGGDILYKFAGNGPAYNFKQTGVNNMNIVNDYSVFPNPAIDNLFVKGADNATYTITNIVGQVLAIGKIDARNNQVNISMLAAGLYLINLTENVNTKKVKFVKE